MKVMVFGGTGMVGQGVLRECLLEPQVESVLVVGRTATGQQHPKLREIVHPDLLDLTPIAGELAGYDACFFCLGVSAVGLSEPDYRRVTYDITMSVARTLATQNPELTFIYVSGMGTDSAGRAMWARVKGETENALLGLPFRAYLMRPGLIQPRHGIVSKTAVYRLIYAVLAPLYPVLKVLLPNYLTTTEQVGRAMIRVAQRGGAQRVLEIRDINAAASG